MSSDSRRKLNLLLRGWPSHTVMVYAQLKMLGIYQQLVDRYVRSGWLESIGRGAFIHTGDEVDWTGALYALQKHLGLFVHVGGKTAFELLGAAHFPSLGKGGDVWLYGEKGAKLPNWFTKDTSKKWGCRIEYVDSRIFNLSDSGELGLIEHNVGNYTVTVSTKERAILEMLYLVPAKQNLVEAKYLAEGLMALRPDVMQKLLEQCCSIKVKRLFLFLADFCDLPCLQQLDLSKINLGKGKRVIGKGGRYIAKYSISLPESFVNTFSSEFEKSEK
jgi:hypothetical protein